MRFVPHFCRSHGLCSRNCHVGWYSDSSDFSIFGFVHLILPRVGMLTFAFKIKNALDPATSEPLSLRRAEQRRFPFVSVTLRFGKGNLRISHFLGFLGFFDLWICAPDPATSEPLSLRRAEQRDPIVSEPAESGFRFPRDLRLCKGTCQVGTLSSDLVWISYRSRSDLVWISC